MPSRERRGTESPSVQERLGPALFTPFDESEGEHDPGSVAGSVAWDRLRLAEQRLAPDAHREEPGQRARRLAADARLVEVLRQDSFDGARFRKFASRLLEYGYPVLLRWTKSGEIFAQCAHAGRPVRRHAATFDWTAEDRHRLATDTLLEGVEFFRSYALERGGWDPERGASLTTYFIGSCVRCFPPVYNRWWREQILEQGMLHVALGTGAEDETSLTDVADPRSVDPCHAAVVSDQVQQVMNAMPDPALRTGLALRAIGYSQSEAADRVGLTEKALERRVGRARSRLRDDQDGLGSDQDLGEGGSR
ncbi:hypothetical protein [Streptomyces sp. NPDC051776]|uniref:RNA polymerase sigma factor n=1 Tax=Streptomyces sp. NPDC051776 TaxID=3155414 RepID=UPI0034302079